MSEICSSYHIMNGNKQDVIETLKGLGISAYVFNEKNNWVTFLADKKLLKIIAPKINNVIVQFFYSEDFCWILDVYQNEKNLFYYCCIWEDGIKITKDNFDIQIIKNLFNINENEISLYKLFHPKTFDEIFENCPAYVFAEMIGLHYYKWLSYEDPLFSEISENEYTKI